MTEDGICEECEEADALPDQYLCEPCLREQREDQDRTDRNAVWNLLYG